jgi:bifunctional N-acetylglucosamine-1-phosphate-uridyltransferase/glucosamine-1-phosphate-acetyltransferase GlmU-like protein
VLAAGLGTRMRSTTPKVLHQLCGRPMLAYTLDAWTSTANGAATADHRHYRRCAVASVFADVATLPPG